MHQRHSYPKPFKAQVVQECLQAGASIASVALSHGINANLVRKWIPLYRDEDGKNLPAFTPLKLEPRVMIVPSHRSESTCRAWEARGELARQRARGMCPICPGINLVIRIDSIWLATEPMDMRAGTDTSLARVTYPWRSKDTP